MLRIEYLGVIGSCFFWILFAVSYADYGHWLTRRTIAFLLVIPVLTFLQILTVDRHDLFYASYELVIRNNLVLFTKVYGPGFYVWLAYAYSGLVGGVVMLSLRIMNMPRRFWGQMTPPVLILIVLVPLNFLYTVGKNPFAPYDPSCISFMIVGASFLFTFTRRKFLRVLPMVYSLVLKNVNCGIMIIDERMRIMDINPAAMDYLSLSRQDLLGTGAPDAFAGHADLAGLIRDAYKGKNGRIEVEYHRRFFEVQVSPINRRSRKYTWFIVILYDITKRKQMEQERIRLIAELKSALFNVKTLKKLLPICSSCKKIRDDQGYWHQVDSYIKRHSGLDFSHGICPDCAREIYPELMIELDAKK